MDLIECLNLIGFSENIILFFTVTYLEREETGYFKTIAHWSYPILMGLSQTVPLSLNFSFVFSFWLIKNVIVFVFVLINILDSGHNDPTSFVFLQKICSYF